MKNKKIMYAIIGIVIFVLCCAAFRACERTIKDPNSSQYEYSFLD